MTGHPHQAPEDLGAPQSYLVLKEGTPVYDRSGSHAGTVEHVLADEQQDIFHGLIVHTRHGDRFARSDVVEGIYERGVIVSVPAAELPEPSEDAVARAVDDEPLAEGLRRAVDWLVRRRRRQRSR